MEAFRTQIASGLNAMIAKLNELGYDVGCKIYDGCLLRRKQQCKLPQRVIMACEWRHRMLRADLGNCYREHPERPDVRNLQFMLSAHAQSTQGPCISTSAVF